MAEIPAIRASSPYPAPAVAWYATLVLALLYWLSILDRFIISLMVDPIKRDLGINDLQFSLLHGLAFALTYSLLGLAAGALADRFSRRNIIFACVAIWSLATAACGMAQNFVHMLLARIGVGAGEAGLNPSATSMLSDLFPRERLTAAMAVYAIGASIGSGTAYFFGGAIIDLVAKTDTIVLPLLGELRSWQAVFFIIGIPGALLSFIVFTFPEPARTGVGRQLATAAGGIWSRMVLAYRELLRFMRPNWKFFAYHYAGFAMASIVLAGPTVWYPAHMGRTFGWTASQIGLGLGVSLVAAGIAGKLIGGFIVDAMFKRGYRDAQLRWFSACMLLAAPIGVWGTTSNSPWIFLMGAGLFLLLLSTLPACAAAALNLVTPNELRGTGSAFFAATAGLTGGVSGPIVIAAISESVFGGPTHIGLGMATVIAICCPIGAFLLARGCRHMRTAYATNNI
jgi:MFS family permease